MSHYHMITNIGKTSKITPAKFNIIKMPGSFFKLF